MTLQMQIIWLFLLAIPIASISWTVTHEEVFRELREYCRNGSTQSKTFLKRKFFYILTCEYCFSHYITAFVLIITRYHLLIGDWRGYFISFFALVWVANVYMSLFNLIRVDIKKDNIESKVQQKGLDDDKK